MAGGPVVVGIAATRGGDPRVVGWAAREAAALGVGLRLVNALVVPAGGQLVAGLSPATALRHEAERDLAAAAQTAREAAPEVPVETAVVDGGPVPVLRAEAQDASLVVVGSDGLGPVLDLVLGGIARALAGHVDVPVAVIPAGYDAGSPRTAGVVLVADDGTPATAAARRYADARAARRGATVDEAVFAPGRRADPGLVERTGEAEVVVMCAGPSREDVGRRAVPGVVRGASCPVVVVPAEVAAEVPAAPTEVEPVRDPDLVVTGFDGSPDSETALRYAVGEAARRGGAVRVVTAFESPDTWMMPYGIPVLPDDGEAQAKVGEHVHAQVRALVAGLDAGLRDVPVETVTVTGPPTAVLLEAARDAAVLVVGHRGRGGLRSVLLGSVGMGVVLRAPCPVVVVPA